MEGKQILVLIVLIAGIIFFIDYRSETQAIIDIPLTLLQIPRGVGYGNLMNPDGLLTDLGWDCADLYGRGGSCCGACSKVLQPGSYSLSVKQGNDPIRISSINEFYFEGDYININISTNVGYNTPNKTVAIAWYERDIDKSSIYYEDAINKYHKSVEWFDLSREKNLDIPQDLIFSLGKLPIGEYRFYVVLAEVIPTGAFRNSCCQLVTQTLPNAYPADFYSLSNILEVNFIVNPKPVTQFTFNGSNCSNGYVIKNPLVEDPNSDGICDAKAGAKGCTCVRNDLRDLPCSRIGCPITVDETGKTIGYSCGSDGMCSEILFTPSLCLTNADCGAGQVCDNIILNGNGAGICYNELIYDSFIGYCKNNTDCYNPQCKDSSGNSVTPSCSLGKCSYSGQCDVQLKDCKTLGCPTNFVCMDTGQCQRTITETIVNETVKEIIREVEKPSFISENWVIILLIGLIGGALIYFIKWK